MPQFLKNTRMKPSELRFYFINRLPSSILKRLTPVEALLHVLPQYDSLRVFGCSCLILEILTSTSSNSDQLSALFIGHHLNHKGYKRLDPRKVIISQNVVFDEFFFPFAKKSNCTDQQTSAS